MSPLELGLAAWLTFNLSIGVNLQATLLPKATAGQIQEVEKAVGYSLPQDLQALYLQFNGQLDPFRTSFKGRYAPMFGRYRFLTLSEALTAHKQLHTQYQADQQWQADANGGQAVTWEVRAGDRVDSAGWNPRWFVFASDESSYYSVDMSPPVGGQEGQVVLHGPDKWELRVIADSVSQLFSLAASNLDPAEAHRYEQSQMMSGTGDDAWSYLQFTMDWREQPEIPGPVDTQQNAALDAWYEARESNISQFMVWLDDGSWNASEKARLEEWVYVNFSLGPSALFAGPLPDNVGPPYTHQDYLVALEMSLIQSVDPMLEGLPVTRAQAYELVHQFQLKTGRWSEQEYSDARALLLRFAD